MHTCRWVTLHSNSYTCAQNARGGEKFSVHECAQSINFVRSHVRSTELVYWITFRFWDTSPDFNRHSTYGSSSSWSWELGFGCWLVCDLSLTHNSKCASSSRVLLTPGLLAACIPRCSLVPLLCNSLGEPVSTYLVAARLNVSTPYDYFLRILCRMPLLEPVFCGIPPCVIYFVGCPRECAGCQYEFRREKFSPGPEANTVVITTNVPNL